MASRRRANGGEQRKLPVEDYRNAGTSRPNNPPAADGRTPPAPRTTSAYSARLDPALRTAASGRAHALPARLENTTREELTAEEAALLAEVLRRHELWLEWAGKRETPNFRLDPLALHVNQRVRAVNNWGNLGRWSSHVCRNPQVLERELMDIAQRLRGAA